MKTTATKNAVIRKIVGSLADVKMTSGVVTITFKKNWGHGKIGGGESNGVLGRLGAAGFDVETGEYGNEYVIYTKARTASGQPAPVSPVCKSEDKAAAKPTALESVLWLCRTQVVNAALADKAKAEHAALVAVAEAAKIACDDLNTIRGRQFASQYFEDMARAKRTLNESLAQLEAIRQV